MMTIKQNMIGMLTSCLKVANFTFESRKSILNNAYRKWNNQRCLCTLHTKNGDFGYVIRVSRSYTIYITLFCNHTAGMVEWLKESFTEKKCFFNASIFYFLSGIVI